MLRQPALMAACKRLPANRILGLRFDGVAPKTVGVQGCGNATATADKLITAEEPALMRYLDAVRRQPPKRNCPL